MRRSRGTPGRLVPPMKEVWVSACLTYFNPSLFVFVPAPVDEGRAVRPTERTRVDSPSRTGRSCTSGVLTMPCDSSSTPVEIRSSIAEKVAARIALAKRSRPAVFHNPVRSFESIQVQTIVPPPAKKKKVVESTLAIPHVSLVLPVASGEKEKEKEKSLVPELSIPILNDPKLAGQTLGRDILERFSSLNQLLNTRVYRGLALPAMESCRA